MGAPLSKTQYKGFFKVEEAEPDEYTEDPTGMTMLPEESGPKGDGYGGNKRYMKYPPVRVETIEVGKTGFKEVSSHEIGEIAFHPESQSPPLPAVPKAPGGEPAEEEETLQAPPPKRSRKAKAETQPAVRNNKVNVTFSGAFGTVEAVYAEAIQEGISIVLISPLGSGFAYEPPMSQDAFEVTITNKTYRAYMGVGFKLPSHGIKVTVLFKE